MPIMIGTTGEKMLRLTAEHADLWNAWGLNSAAGVAAAQAKVDAACAAVGRDPASLGRTCTVLVDLPGRAGRPRETPPFLAGDDETLAETLREHARAGISHVQIVLDPNTVDGVEAFARVLERLDRS
jgi:alkanesulfonate monooxygenase SsuD/methylene tetrahydromethanopterin reductase-like flavin-dependent oxidoreductase (luciferase family)